MTVDLTAIREHHEGYTGSHNHIGSFDCCTAHASADDVPSLIAEVERLRAALDDIRVLHVDSPAGFCPSCGRLGDVSDTDDGLVAWPCPTTRVIQAVNEETNR